MLSESEMLEDTRIKDNKREIVTAADPSPPVQPDFCRGRHGRLFRINRAALHRAGTGSRSAVRMVRVAFTLDRCHREPIFWVVTTGGIRQREYLTFDSTIPRSYLNRVSANDVHL
jgi:hypothetical protein